MNRSEGTPQKQPHQNGKTTDNGVRFSVNIVSGGPAETSSSAAIADDAGFDLLRVADVQSTHREAYCSLMLVATNTRRARLGPGVTNPVTRHPAVTASAIATVDEASGGRSFLGIGTGDSAVRNAGLRPSRLAALGDYILAVRDLHQNGRAKFKGNNLRLTWWSGKRIPILMAAHGPKSLQMAGQVADGVVVGVGLTPEATEYAFDHIERGAKKAGRDLKEIDVWFMSLLNLTDNADAPVSGIEASLAASGNLLARSDARATVPAKLHKKLDALAERYHYDHHTDNAPSSRNGLLLSELGLGPYLSERFGLAGTGHQVRERVHGLAARSVTCHWGMYHGRNRDDFLARWGREILDREIGY